MKNEERLHSAQNFNNRINRVDYGDLSCGDANYRDDGKMLMNVPVAPPTAQEQSYYKSMVGHKNVVLFNAYDKQNKNANNIANVPKPIIPNNAPKK